MSVDWFPIVGFSLTQNRSNFLYVESCTTWLYDCPHHLSPLVIAEKCYDEIPINYLDTVKYVEPITRQTFDYATPIPCENNSQHKTALSLDTDQHFVLTAKPIISDPRLLFETRQIETAFSPNTFTAQDTEMYSKQELKHFRDHVLFAKHSDNTHQLLGNPINYDFMSKTDTLPVASQNTNPYNIFRIGLSVYL